MVKVFFQKDLDKLLSEKFSSCEKTEYISQIHEFKSQVEQELCLKSTIFMESDGSTWSSAINKERFVRGISEFDGMNNIFFGDIQKEARENMKRRRR